MSVILTMQKKTAVALRDAAEELGVDIEVDDEGCENCFVVSADLIKKAERIVEKYKQEAGK